MGYLLLGLLALAILGAIDWRRRKTEAEDKKRWEWLRLTQRWRELEARRAVRRARG